MNSVRDRLRLELQQLLCLKVHIRSRYRSYIYNELYKLRKLSYSIEIANVLYTYNTILHTRVYINRSNSGKVYVSARIRSVVTKFADPLLWSLLPLFVRNHNFVYYEKMTRVTCADWNLYRRTI